MSHVGWASASATVTSASSARAPAAERAAGRGEHQPVDLLGPAAAQALGQRGVLGVDRHDLPGRAPPPSPARRPRPATPCWPARAWPRRASAASVGPRPTEPVIPLSTMSTARGGGQLGGRVRARRAPRRPAAARAGRAAAASVAPPPRGGTRCARTCSASSATSPPPAASPATVNRSGWRAISVQRLGADRAGGAQHERRIACTGHRLAIILGPVLCDDMARSASRRLAVARNSREVLGGAPPMDPPRAVGRVGLARRVPHAARSSPASSRSSCCSRSC